MSEHQGTAEIEIIVRHLKNALILTHLDNEHFEMVMSFLYSIITTVEPVCYGRLGTNQQGSDYQGYASVLSLSVHLTSFTAYVRLIWIPTQFFYL